MFDRKSDYALNKMDRDAIVYIDADGRIVRLTRESFSSLEDFLAWKDWSDADYHLSEKGSHVFYNHTISLHLLLDVADPASPDTEEESRQARRKYEQRCAALVDQLRRSMTEAQFRRLWMHYVDGMTEKQIAQVEGVGQQRVSKSILTARKKAKSFFENFCSMCAKQGVKRPANRR